jgi:ubiquinone/menaquinone biosynthesis C-methylase UbiE
MAGILFGIGCAFAAQHSSMHWLWILVAPAISLGGTFLATALVMIWGSKVGKLRLRDRVIASIPWKGSKFVLDVGCGRGLMLIAAAKRLTIGSAVGVDLWQKVDQSGNSRETTLRNIQIEQVAQKITLKDGDARKLEFADNTFDIVLSSWAIHNIYDAPGRETAIREIVRVLKPGGRVVIVDIQQVHQYAQVLRQCQMLEIKISRPNFLFVIPTLTLTAQKPVG